MRATLHFTQRSLTRPLVLLVVLAVALGALLLYYGLTLGDGQGTTTAQAGEPEMSLGATGDITCDDPDAPTTCDVEFDPGDPPASEFTLTVNASVIPEGDYSGFGSEVFFGGLTYVARPRCTDEVVWPDELLCLESDGEGGQRQLGSGTGIFTPLPTSSFVGTLVELDVHCPDEGSFTVALTALPSSGLGANYIAPDGATVLVETAGSEQLDLDGDTTPETVDVADTLEITCSEAEGAPLQGPTATPPSALDTSRWLTYTSPLGFTIKYPPDWTVEVEPRFRLLNPVAVQAFADATAQGAIDTQIEPVPGMAEFSVAVLSSPLDADSFVKSCETPDPMARVDSPPGEARGATLASQAAVTCQKTVIYRSGLVTMGLSYAVEYTPGRHARLGGYFASATSADLAVLAAIATSINFDAAP